MSNQLNVPEGFALVPIEATDEMIDAACKAGNLYRVDAMRAIEAAVAAHVAPVEKGSSRT